MAKPSSEVVWTRILGCEGQVFTQIRGGEFSYLCSGESIDLSRTNQKIHRFAAEQLQDSRDDAHLAEPRKEEIAGPYGW